MGRSNTDILGSGSVVLFWLGLLLMLGPALLAAFGLLVMQFYLRCAICT